ncbi:MAG: hypothetical protein H7Y42_14955 [Chitinophagaceae bacterium]|nr:hypothetical protein [Chitinophagaceae bacterium]
MRYLRTVAMLFLFAWHTSVQAQDETGFDPSITIFTGLMNYQGDLNPNSFSIAHSKFAFGLSIRQPLSRWFTARAGIQIGRLEAADRYNRDYLKTRNLSFFTPIHEAYAALEFTFLDISKSRFTPYLYGGISVFHFNPWTYDNSGEKWFLQPLSTEGQGIEDFPSHRPYKLTQFALPFGMGLRYAVSNDINIGVEFSQRKTFTDHLDDVSSFYVDREILLAARGEKAVELAFRGNTVPGGGNYPAHGEQRGTPTEMDWYYYGGITIDIKLNSIGNMFRGIGTRDKGYSQRCPRPL